MTTQPPTPAQGSEAVPTCYRHPDRETYVRCQRCDRPICPDCMREAAVGHQCVECVAEGNRDVRKARTVFGGGLVARPYVTWTILGVIVLLFLVQRFTRYPFAAEFAMNPAWVAFGEQYYRLITSAFLHANEWHILFNGWALLVIGSTLERALGHVRFLALYLLAALGGSVLGYWLDGAGVFTVGASGAIYGLFAATFVIGRRLKLDVRGVLLLIVINLVITFLPGFNISWTGHLGGLITGAIVAAALAYAPKSGRTIVQGVAVAAVLLILIALVIVRTNTILLNGFA
ncbi:rhomboid family intramembrane serine protease [Thermopolyspora sp. NPDC052614]|uniref:rhomboid family intramembrane serine protease n=1 Tax=Thermopolyspora sp. NPDC052614 TaxID=3155682 RepID=UPI0034142DE2